VCYVRKNNLAKFGITPEEYDGLLAAQAGVCAICGGDNGSKRLAVDHDHDTGVIRGLLCNQCNRGLGLLGDSAESIRRVLDYLESHV